MADWDENSPQLQQNLEHVLRQIRDEARRREAPTVEAARHWHAGIMRSLQAPDPQFIGKFRGEAGVEDIEVRIGRHRGAPARDIATALRDFEARLRQAVALLDDLLPAGTELDADGVSAVIDLCAWAHAEWTRIHPFANGNGRTARFWANSLAMRYGLPPFVRLRPRPDGGYGAAGERAMRGDWEAMAMVFRDMLHAFFGTRRS